MSRGKRKWGEVELISAQEVACFTYCPEQWRLQYGLGLAPGNKKLLVAGIRHHNRKAVAERIAGGLIVIGRLLAVIGFVVLFLWLVVFR